MTTILRISTLLMLCCFLTSISSCQKPSVEKIEKIEILSIEEDGLKANLLLGIYNPRFYSVKGNDLSLRLYYNNSFIASGYSKEMDLSAKEITNVPFDMTFNLKILDKYGDELLLKDSILLVGTLEGDYTFLDIHRVENLSYWIKTKDLTDKLSNDALGEDGVDVKSISIEDIGLSTSTVKVNLGINNSLNIPIKIDSMNIEVFSDVQMSSKVGDWRNNESKIINRKTEEIIIAKLIIQNASAVLTGATKILNGFDYYAKGLVYLKINDKPLTLPIQKHLRIYPMSREVKIIND